MSPIQDFVLLREENGFKVIKIADRFRMLEKKSLNDKSLEVNIAISQKKINLHNLQNNRKLKVNRKSSNLQYVL